MGEVWTHPSAANFGSEMDLRERAKLRLSTKRSSGKLISPSRAALAPVKSVPVATEIQSSHLERAHIETALAEEAENQLLHSLALSHYQAVRFSLFFKLN
jgi:hypothetical protein